MKRRNFVVVFIGWLALVITALLAAESLSESQSARPKTRPGGNPRSPQSTSASAGGTTVVGANLHPRIPLDDLLSVREDKGDWLRLFNGKDLIGFHTYLRGQGDKDPEHVFSVSGGCIHVFKATPQGKAMPFGGVITDRDYGDFHLRFEFKWGTKKFAPRTERRRDAGLLFHVFDEVDSAGGNWASSVECQIQENDVGDVWAVRTRVSSLAVSGASGELTASFKTGQEVTIGERKRIMRLIKARDEEREGWNTIEIIARGDAAAYLVNGKPVNYVYHIRRPDPANPSGWIPLTKGRLWFQAEGAEVFYRNIELRALPPLNVEATSSP